MVNSSLQQAPTFTASKGNNALTFRFLMEGGRPVKLGDGTFGSVFAVEDADRTRYAVKIFYHTDDQDARLSFLKEMRATQDINHALHLAKRDSALANLVLPVARTETFRSSDAAAQLQPYFTEVNLSISDFAFVMERYECTLKDLLEKGRSGASSAGYDRLRLLPLLRREKLVLWIGKEIATALCALHIAKLHHHDLKPANVLLRERGGRLEVGLADLGFLEPNRVFGTQMVGNSNLLPIGTRHYRSPEHKDYFDVCEALIRESSRSCDILETLDPKFRDTLIEAGDMLMYCKDPRRVLRRILEVRSEPGGKTVVVIERANQPLLPQEKTQVVMYKRHTARTDGFGLGAIMYDVLTCGYSPERFYDYFRRWDYPGKDVRSLIRLYKQFHTWQSAALDVVSGFELLRADKSLDKSYPSPAVVGILFRLLLPRSKGSYFANNDGSEAGQSFERILSDLRLLANSENISLEESAQNVIWRGELSIGVHSEPDTDASFQERLAKVQAIADPMARLEIGYWLFDRVARSILPHLEDRDDELPYVADMSAHNVRTGSASAAARTFEIRPRYGIFEKVEDYRRALQDGDLHSIELALKGQLPLAYQFLNRDGFATIARMPHKALPAAVSTKESHLELVVEDLDFDSAPSTSATRDVVSYDITLQYCDGCPFWSELEPGDHVILGLELPRRLVADVESTSVSGAVRITFEWPRSSTPFPWNGEVKRVRAVKRFRKMDYYFAVLGSYIHQIFFVDNKFTRGAIPQEVYLVEQLVIAGRRSVDDYSARIEARLGRTAAGRGPAALVGRLAARYAERRDLEGQEIEESYGYLAELYLWLCCRFFRRGARAGLRDVDHAQDVQRHVEMLGEFIAQTCGRRDRTEVLNIVTLSRTAGGASNVARSNGAKIPDLEGLLKDLARPADRGFLSRVRSERAFARHPLRMINRK